MRKIVVLPGGYHPYHAGHYSLFKAAEEKFPDADVYLAATNDTKTRPFPFEIKKKLAQLAGVNPNQFVQVKSPFKAEEITQKYDPENDVLIFVRSEKDRNEQPKPGGTKKDGSPSYFQPYDPDNLESFNKHAYMEYLPTIEFGPGIKSASEIRNAWPNLNERQKLAMVMSLYPATQKNKKLADVAVKMLDAGIIGDQVNEEGVEEAILINDPEQGYLIQPDGGMGTWDEQSLLSNLTRKFSSMVEMIKEKRYSNLYHSLYEAGVVENMLKALVEYENFKTKQGSRPIAKNRSIDMSQVKESSAFTEGISDVIKSVMNKNKVKGVSLTKDIGQYVLIAEKGAGDFYVKAYSKGNMYEPAGGVVFVSTDGGKTFYSDDTYVYNPHKRKGIATAMYNFAREHGLNIVPSSEQSPDGEKFTKSYFSNKNVKESTDYISEK